MSPDVASPLATGGAGTFYEQHVGATFLAFLLVRGSAPFGQLSPLVSVMFQSGRLGYATDDMLLVTEDADGGVHRAIVQCKRSFTVTKSDDDFAETVVDAWADFRNPDVFTSGRDVLGLVAQEVPAAAAKGLQLLLDAARSSRNPEDLEERLAPGYTDQSARRCRGVIEAIVEQAHGVRPTPAELLAFLQAWRFLSMDVCLPGSAMVASIHTMLTLAGTAPEASRAEVASQTWQELLSLAGQAMPAATTYTRETLPDGLLLRYRPTAHTEQERILRDLERISASTRRTLHDDIHGVHVSRTRYEQAVAGALESKRLVVVTGEAGVGKSALVDSVLRADSPSAIVVALRPGLIGAVEASPARLARLSPLRPSKTILIESAERILEMGDEERVAFTELIEFVRADSSWRLIVTCRDRHLAHVIAGFLADLAATMEVVRIDGFSDEELDVLQQRLPRLRAPLAQPRLARLLRNPFILKQAASLDWDAGIVAQCGRAPLRTTIWAQVIRRDQEQADGAPSRRDATFVNVCRQRAQALAPFVASTDLDPAAVALLKRDDLLVESPLDPELIAPAHDVLEDWALLQWLTRTWFTCNGSWADFVNRMGADPMRRREFA